MTLITFLFSLLLTLPAPTLTLDKSAGPAPLHITATVGVSGPFTGQVCVVVSEETAVVGVLCTVNDTEEVAAGVRRTFDIQLVGTQPGTYILHPAIHNDDLTQFGEPLQVKVTEGQ